MIETLKHKDKDKPKPRKFWQWILVYPTLIISILGYMPSIIERVSAATSQGSISSLFSSSHDLQSYEIWARNGTCWGSTTIDFKAIDIAPYHIGVTPCPGTGDIWVRVQDTNNNDPKTNTSFVWIGHEVFLKGKVTAAFLEKIIPGANALETANLNGTQLVQVFPIKVQCQFIMSSNPAIIVRRYLLNTGICYDEYFSRINGQLVGRNIAPTCACIG